MSKEYWSELVGTLTLSIKKLEFYFINLPIPARTAKINIFKVLAEREEKVKTSKFDFFLFLEGMKLLKNFKT